MGTFIFFFFLPFYSFFTYFFYFKKMHTQGVPDSVVPVLTGGVPDGEVQLEVCHSVLSPNGGSNNWKLFSKNQTVEDLKKKLERIVGTPPQYMELELRNLDGTVIAKLEQQDQTLDSYNPENGKRLHIVDNDPNQTVLLLQDTSQVEKYTMSDESYNERDVTFKKWKEQNTVNSVNEEHRVGAKCIVNGNDGSKREGTIRYIGPVADSSNIYIGVEFGQPLGKNDGSAKGKRYFECKANHGSFLKPPMVKMIEEKTADEF